MYEIEISPGALKFLERLKKSGHKTASRITSAIDALKTQPHLGKKLMGGLEGFRSLRVGEFRVIYLVIDKRVFVQVVSIAHRREVYR